MVVEVLAGNDYPHRIGSLGKMVSSVNQLDTVDEEKESVLGGDAVRLLGL